MAEKIIQFRQLELPLVWWNDSELWRERILKRAHTMATEDAVLDDIYWEVEALKSRNYIKELSPLQRRIDDELQAFTNKTGYSEGEKAKAIAAKIHQPVSVVLSEIQDIIYIMRYIAKTDHLLAKVAKYKAAWECLQEITAESLLADAA